MPPAGHVATDGLGAKKGLLGAPSTVAGGLMHVAKATCMHQKGVGRPTKLVLTVPGGESGGVSTRITVLQAGWKVTAASAVLVVATRVVATIIEIAAMVAANLTNGRMVYPSADMALVGYVESLFVWYLLPADSHVSNNALGQETSANRAQSCWSEREGTNVMAAQALA